MRSISRSPIYEKLYYWKVPVILASLSIIALVILGLWRPWERIQVAPEPEVTPTAPLEPAVTPTATPEPEVTPTATPEPEVTPTAESADAGDWVRTPAGTYVVRHSDYLSLIAKGFYGNGNRWPELYEANRDIISNPCLIYPGQELDIP